MKYDDLVVLIPSHSLEDFPTDLGEEDASALLNAFSVVWHPQLLASAQVIPSWDRADDPPDVLYNRLFIIPPASEEWLPVDWIDQARAEDSIVITGISDRWEMLEAALAPLEEEKTVDPELAADFLALGTCYLQLELLTRHMHHFDNVDEVHLQREAVAAAKAALDQDEAAAKERLHACFEVLLEARERFYPVDCYLLDLCLIIPRLADEHLEKTLSEKRIINFLVTARDLEEIANEKPQLIERIREAWQGETADLLGGEYDEPPAPLLPLNSFLHGFEHGREVFQKKFQRPPSTWARRRFGLATLLPQILNRYGYHSALHFAFDDGLFPETEQSKVRWEGCDGTVLDAVSRIPLPADSAASYLRFPMRMAESMEEDHVATVLFARWPEVKAPWFDDFRRIHRYLPVLGRFVTMDDFFEHTDTPGRMSSFEAGEYLSPFLIQAVARQEQNPISRYARHFFLRRQFDSACWYRGLSSILRRQEVCDNQTREGERLIEAAGPEAPSEAVEKAESFLKEFVPESQKKLAQIVTGRTGSQPGVLLLNPLPFSRRTCVELPQFQSPPQLSEVVQAVQFDENHRTAVVELPGSGFVWLPLDSETKEEKNADKNAEIPIATENVLRNEFFEVHINQETGGILRIKEYGRRPNRLSQQLAFRFPRERTVVVGEGDEAEEEKTPYSEMRGTSLEITCQGPTLGEIVTTGELIDQQDGSRLVGFRQTFRLWRARPLLEVEIELEIDRMPEGDPWSNYVASRFAWNDPTASFTRSVLEGAQGIRGERFESPHYIEIASDDERTTILSLGRPFHRKTGPRMVDSLLVTEGEEHRKFRILIAVDENYPLQAALDGMTDVPVIPTEGGPPPTGPSGWFFHFDSKNVQILKLTDLLPEPNDETEDWEMEESERPQKTLGSGFAVRMMETEGRRKRVQLRCFQTPYRARQRDFQGRTITELPLEDDAILLEVTPYEILDVELFFDGH